MIQINWFSEQWEQLAEKKNLFKESLSSVILSPVKVSTSSTVFTSKIITTNDNNFYHYLLEFENVSKCLEFSAWIKWIIACIILDWLFKVYLTTVFIFVSNFIPKNMPDSAEDIRELLSEGPNLKNSGPRRWAYVMQQLGQEATWVMWFYLFMKQTWHIPF